MKNSYKLLLVALMIVLVSGTALAKYNESPLLAEQVKAGLLPPVEERLPVNPLVIEPYEKIGKYGGIIRSTHTGPGDSTGYQRLVHEPLVYYDEMFYEIHPNLAESWSVSEDGKVITFKLREGLKWSDGHPFTTDDILFWWEDVQLNTELTPAVNLNFQSGGEPMKVVKIDDLTVEFRFKEPKGGFVNWMATGHETYLPKHYLQQFHIKYTDEATLNRLAREHGVTLWSELFRLKAGLSSGQKAVGMPTMDAWVLTTGFDAPVKISERNPYYFKVDTAGNQLPYIDAYHRELVGDVEIMKLKLIGGQIDYQTRHLWTMYGDLPLFLASQDSGNYRVIQTEGGTPGLLVMHFNQNYDADPEIAKLLRNKDFRIALSYAIDREEMNELLLNGLGAIGHGHLHPLHPAYSEEADKMYTDYNPALANKMLDELGLTARDEEGFRLLPNGQRLTLIVDGSTHHWAQVDGGQLIKDYWEAVGIRTVINLMERALYESKRQGNQHQIGFADFADPIIPLLQTGHQITYVVAPLWETWLTTNGRDGVEPPADVKRIYEIYTDIAPSTDDEEVRTALMREIIDIWADNFWTIGTVGMHFNLSFANKDLRNVPAPAAHSHPGNPGIYRPFQWFWDR